MVLGIVDGDCDVLVAPSVDVLTHEMFGDITGA